MSRAILAFLVGLSLVLTHRLGRCEPASSSPPGDLARSVIEIVRKDFYNPRELTEFEALVKRQAPRAVAAPNTATPPEEDASGKIDALLTSLHCSHTRRYTPDQLEYYEALDTYGRVTMSRRIEELFPKTKAVSYAGIGVATRQANGQSFVAYVYDGSPAQRAGLAVGDELVTVDGKPFAPIASFSGKAGRRVEIRLRRQRNGATTTVSVPVEAIQPSAMFESAIRESVRVITRSKWRFGYVRLWTFAGESIRSLLAKVLSSDPISGTDGLVLDLRGRWGGAPPDAGEMFVGRTPHMELIDASGKVLPVNVRWRRPLVAIIDEGTRSGMEILAYSLKGGGIPLIGAKTAGDVIGGKAYLLADNSLMLLAVMDVRIDGKRLEGIGVHPTVPVPFDIRYAAGRDPRLDRALIELTERMPESSGPGKPSSPD